MSSPTNNVKVEKERASQVPINPGTAFNSGDLMKWDSANLVATPVVAGDAASNAAAALVIGVSQDTNPVPSLGQYLAPTTTTAGVPAGASVTGTPARINIVTRGLVLFTCDDNATYNPGDAVTLGADPQKIRHTSPSASNVIGFVAPENSFAIGGTGQAQGIAATQGVTQLIIAIQPQFKQLVSI